MHTHLIRSIIIYGVACLFNNFILLFNIKQDSSKLREHTKLLIVTFSGFKELSIKNMFHLILSLSSLGILNYMSILFENTIG